MYDLLTYSRDSGKNVILISEIPYFFHLWTVPETPLLFSTFTFGTHTSAK